MKLLRLSIILLLISFVAGCATFKPNFAVKERFWENKKQTIGIAVAKIPQPEAHKTGGQGLLDIAINNANASELGEHLAKQDVQQINKTTDKMFSYLRGKGFNVVKIEDQIDAESLKEVSLSDDESKKIYYTNRDFTPLKTKYNIDKIVLVTLDKVGTIRNYYGFVPLGAPSGYSKAVGQIINLENNQLEWNYVIDQQIPTSESEWDVPPSFPGLTKAMYTAFNQTQELLFNEFTKN